MRVPKIIMQTWKTTEVPEKWKESPKTIKEYMSDWDHRLMTDEDNLNFVSKYFPDFLEKYKKLKYPIQRADAIRYMWLYVNGGIYMDLDYKLRKSLEELLDSDDDLFFVRSPNVKKCFTNSLMASGRNNKFWLEVVKECFKPVTKILGKHYHVMFTTGPVMLTRMINRLKPKFREIKRSLVAPCSVCNLNCLGSKKSHAVQLEGSSWISWDSKIYLCVWCNSNKIAAFFAFLFILILLLKLLA